MTLGRCWSVVLLAVLAGGCVPRLSYLPVVPPPRPLEARGGAQVDTFLVTPPARPHADIGMVRTSTYGDSYDETLAHLMAELRAMAGQHGCDALVITFLDVYPRGTNYGGGIQGSCEVYINAAAAPAPPPCPPAATETPPPPRG